MSQPADVSGQWSAYKEPDGLWTIRNRQTGMRVATDMAEPDALVCAQAERMRALLQQIADAPCDHGEQPFCPRNEAYRLLKTIKGG